MNIQNNTKKETAILNEQQLKSNQEIINDIITILANNKLTITDSKNLLHEISKVICNQKVISPNISSGWINATDYSNNANN